MVVGEVSLLKIRWCRKWDEDMFHMVLHRIVIFDLIIDNKFH